MGAQNGFAHATEICSIERRPFLCNGGENALLHVTEIDSGEIPTQRRAFLRLARVDFLVGMERHVRAGLARNTPSDMPETWGVDLALDLVSLCFLSDLPDAPFFDGERASSASREISRARLPHSARPISVLAAPGHAVRTGCRER
jgi:hypothetical protein